jgi:hypothetical protein
MLFKLLSNINYIFYFCIIAFVLLILTYIIYKLFIIEADIYIIYEKINKIELEFSGGGGNNNNSCCINNNKSHNLSEIIMNEVFNSHNSVLNEEECVKDIDVIDIDNLINNDKPTTKETDDSIEDKVLFDLKKDVTTVINDNESVISSSNNQLTKKKLQKMNLDKLKEKCSELEVSIEGTKSQLIDRILNELNKEV